MRRFLLFLPLLFLLFTTCRQITTNSSSKKEAITIVLPQTSPARVTFGVEKLKGTLVNAGYLIEVVTPDKQPKNQGTIISFKPKQDESSYPQFVPGLFDDEDDQS